MLITYGYGCSHLCTVSNPSFNPPGPVLLTTSSIGRKDESWTKHEVLLAELML